MSNVTVTYLFDPLCGWCYGASPGIERLRRQPGVSVTLAPTGLFSGESARPMTPDFAAYAWANDQRIAALSGQTFTPDYCRNVLEAPQGRFDSGPATAALMAVRLTEPAREYDALALLQTARYVQGQDNASLQGVKAILTAGGFDAARRALEEQPDQIADLLALTLSSSRRLMRQIRAQGVPALAVTGTGAPRPLDAGLLFQDFDALMEQINAA